MAAPSSTQWGGYVGDYGRLGICAIATESTATQVRYKLQFWFWSKYSVSDDNNGLYYAHQEDTTPDLPSTGYVSKITTSIDTGSGWNTGNQVMLKEVTGVLCNRRKSAFYLKVSAKLTGVDRVGGTMYCIASFAVHALPTYTITFDANGGTGAPSPMTQVHGYSVQQPSAIPTKTGETFARWTYEKNGNSAPLFPYIPNKNTTLYALYIPNSYTVTFNANGGTGAPSNQTKIGNQNLVLSSTIPIREGYAFKGWGTNSWATTASYGAGDTYSGNANLTLYAVWELTYQKPKIANLSISRCDSTGTAADDGTYALVSFNWETDNDITQCKISWGSSDSEETAENVSASGKSGSVSLVVGDGAVSTERTYSFSVYAEDSLGYSYAFSTLAGNAFPIDVLAGGRGVAIGKPAELEGVFDIALSTHFAGGIQAEVLETHNDLNLATTPNFYVSVNQGASYYSNCPIKSGTFLLEVMNAGAEGQIYQRLTTTFKDGGHEVYERHYYQGSWGSWVRTYHQTNWTNLALNTNISVGTELGYLKARVINDVLYIKGDVKGLTMNWEHFATVPMNFMSKISAYTTAPHRFSGVYYMSNFCGIVLMADGKLSTTMNSTGAWNPDYNTTINVAICL